jgi:hypothetical protein
MSKKMVRIFLAFLLMTVSAFAENERFVELTSYQKTMDVSRLTLDDAVWKTVKPYRQPLQPQFLVNPKPAEVGVTEVFVQSINDGKSIAFRLSWKDETVNETPKITGFADGAAIQFPVSREAFPEYFMGEEKHPVHILYWKAWWSKDEKTGFQTTKTAYPNMTSDTYPFDYPVKGEGMEKSQAEKNIFIPGRAAGNPLSSPGAQVISELSSTGPGTITPMKVANTTGAAEWKDGEWSVIFRRPLSVADTGSVRFVAGERMPVAFAVWEGSRGEAGGRKAVSPAWAEVEIQK